MAKNEREKKKSIISSLWKFHYYQKEMFTSDRTSTWYPPLTQRTVRY